MSFSRIGYCSAEGIAYEVFPRFWLNGHESIGMGHLEFRLQPLRVDSFSAVDDAIAFLSCHRGFLQIGIGRSFALHDTVNPVHLRLGSPAVQNQAFEKDVDKVALTLPFR